MMISTVNTDVIESILNRKLKFDDFNFKPLSWQDAFIVKLLKWFDKKIETISERKCKDTFDKELIDNWRLYYEQIVNIILKFTNNSTNNPLHRLIFIKFYKKTVKGRTVVRPINNIIIFFIKI